MGSAIHESPVAARPTDAIWPRGPIASVPSADEVTRAHISQSYRFQHSLGGLPQLNLDAVRAVTERLLDKGLYDQIMFNNGLPDAPTLNADADSGRELLDALAQYETRRAWLRLTRLDEVVPELTSVVEQFYADLSELHGRDIRPEVIKTFVTLFVSSPGTVTPYHIDHTWNYLLQIHGAKTVHLYDPNDLQVLSQTERENWYGQRTPATQRPGLAGVAYDIGPGDGVHHPVNAPHWVQNGPQVSVSLSLGLCLRRSTRDAQVYQFNYLLRRLGMTPTPPNRSAWRDALKSSCIRLVSDRKPNSFDDVLFSGMKRLGRMMKTVGLARYASTKKVEIT